MKVESETLARISSDIAESEAATELVQHRFVNIKSKIRVAKTGWFTDAISFLGREP